MCLCVHAPGNSALIGRGAEPFGRMLQWSSPPIGRSAASDVAHFIIRCVHNTAGARLLCSVHVRPPETAAADLDFFYAARASLSQKFMTGPRVGGP